MHCWNAGGSGSEFHCSQLGLEPADKKRSVASGGRPQSFKTLREGGNMKAKLSGPAIPLRSQARLGHMPVAAAFTQAASEIYHVDQTLIAEFDGISAPRAVVQYARRPSTSTRQD